jgi:CelD/BcsL family acetyltransferase involved in cellulose biosynthesis
MSYTQPAGIVADKRITIQKVQTNEGFHALRAQWNVLLEASPANSYFLTWEWLWLWWESYKDAAHQLYILTFFMDGTLIGIAPLYVNGTCKLGPLNVRRLMFLGTREDAAQSEYMDIIMNADFAKEIIAELMLCLSREDLFDDIQLQMIDESSLSISLLSKAAEDEGYLYHIQERRESPVIKLPATYDEFLGQVSSRVRHTIRNNHKKIQKKYTSVTFRKTQNEDELEDDLAELSRLHQLRWQSRNLPGSFSRSTYGIFHKSVMREMLKRGNLELWFMTVDGTDIAALYNINYNKRIYNYQAGTDIEFDPTIAPGVLLHNHCISEAIGMGLGEYDFLAMGKRDAYKKNWTDLSNHLVDIYMVRPGTKKYLAASLIKLRSYYHQLKSFRSRHES